MHVCERAEAGSLSGPTPSVMRPPGQIELRTHLNGRLVIERATCRENRGMGSEVKARPRLAGAGRGVSRDQFSAENYACKWE